MMVGFTRGNEKDAIDGPSEPEAEHPLDELPAAERAELLAQIDRGLEACASPG